MKKLDILDFAQKISRALRKDSLQILLMLRERTCRFKDLPGNSFTKSRRIKELRADGFIEPVIIEESKARTVVGYKLTGSGIKLLSKFDELFKLS